MTLNIWGKGNDVSRISAIAEVVSEESYPLLLLRMIAVAVGMIVRFMNLIFVAPPSPDDIGLAENGRPSESVPRRLRTSLHPTGRGSPKRSVFFRPGAASLKKP